MKICVKKRVLTLFLDGEESYQKKKKPKPSSFKATSLPVPKKAQGIQIQLSFLHWPPPNKHISHPLHRTLYSPHFSSGVCMISRRSRYPSESDEEEQRFPTCRTNSIWTMEAGTFVWTRGRISSNFTFSKTKSRKPRRAIWRIVNSWP